MRRYVFMPFVAAVHGLALVLSAFLVVFMPMAKVWRYARGQTPSHCFSLRGQAKPEFRRERIALTLSCDIQSVPCVAVVM